MFLAFVPSRRALYAGINAVLPQRVKTALLFSIYPNKRGMAGFRSYYDACTPREFVSLSEKQNLLLKEFKAYYLSDYFFCFIPAYFAWRLWVLASVLILKTEAAETFSVAMRKRICD